MLDGQRRTPKFAWGAPVSNHPQWRVQAAGGVALALLVFGAAVAARRGEGPSVATWLGIAAMALAGGSTIGWTAENLPLESLTAGDWLRGLTLAGLAVLAPILAAAVLVRGDDVPAFAAVLASPKRTAGAAGAGARHRPDRAVRGGDPGRARPRVRSRYKDFPFAPLTGAAVPFAVLALAGARQKGAPDSAKRGTAELAFAAVLALCAVYIVPNESLANWQALWLGALLLALAVELCSRGGARQAHNQEGDGEAREADIVEHDAEAAEGEPERQEHDGRPQQVERGRGQRADTEHRVAEQEGHDLARPAQPGLQAGITGERHARLLDHQVAQVERIAERQETDDQQDVGLPGGREEQLHALS